MDADDNHEASDIESQISGGAGSSASGASRNRSKMGPNRSGPARKPIHMNVDHSVREKFLTEYGFEPICRTSESYHLHPHLAYQRNFLEGRAIKLINNQFERPLIGDVGSGARRHAKARIHCLCPYLQPGDDVRLNMAIRNGNKVCSHTLGPRPGHVECTCGPFDVLLFVHSAYYFTTDELVKALDNSILKVAFIVGHKFPDALGSLAWGEGEYKQDLSSTSPMISMRVKGNAHDYRHPPLPWDNADPVLTDGTVLDVELVEACGDTYLWRVTYRKRRLPHPVGDWSRLLVDESHNGIIHIPGYDRVTRQDMSSIGVESFEVEHLHGYGRWVFATTSTGRILVPRGLVASVAALLHNKPRDAALLRDASFFFRRRLDGVAMSPEDKLRALTLGSALAYTINVQNEIDVTHTIVSRQGPIWELHKTLTSLTPVKVIYLSVLLVLACLTVFLLSVTAIVFTAERESERKQWEFGGPWLVLSIISLVVSLLYCCRFCVARLQSRRTRDNWSSTLYTEARTSSVTDSVVVLPPDNGFPAHPDLRQPLLDHITPGALQVGTDEAPPRHPGTILERVRLEGMGIAEVVPSVPRTDQAAEIVAVTHRVMINQLPVLRAAWDILMDWSNTHAARQIMDIRVQGGPAMYIEWMNQKKFTARQREMFMKEYDTKVKEAPVPSRGQFNAFVKFEKSKSVGREGLPDGIKTRLINGPPDAVKVAVGPWMSRVQSEVQRVWNGRTTNVCYAAGKTPDELGRIADEFAQRVGGWENVVGIWDDCETYDATLGPALLKTRDVVYPAVGVPAEAMAWLHSVDSSGVTAHGVTYKLDEMIELPDGTKVKARILFSGEMDTNLIGSLINGKAHSDGLPQDWPWLMFVMGDDNLVLGQRSGYNIAQIATDLRDHLVELGLKPTQGVSIRRCDWEFCSKLLWWGKDRQSGITQTVFGPKPARWLHRIGWTVSSPNAANFRETMVSSSQDVAHIPLLREYVMKGLVLSSHQRRKGSEWSEMKHVSKAYECVPDNYEILFDRYGIDTPDVVEFDRLLTACTSLPCALSIPWIETGAKRDEE